jgi:hypothetical protein
LSWDADHTILGVLAVRKSDPSAGAFVEIETPAGAETITVDEFLVRMREQLRDFDERAQELDDQSADTKARVRELIEHAIVVERKLASA